VHRGNQQLEPFRETLPQPPDSRRVFIADNTVGKQMERKNIILQVNANLRDFKIADDAISKARSAHAHSQISPQEN
jgi:hypothetical protein